MNNNYCKTANVKQIKTYDFRRSYAKLLVNEGIDVGVSSIQTFNHANPNITLKFYSHMTKNNEDEAIEKVNVLNVNC